MVEPKPKLLPVGTPTVDRLRAHAHRMVWDATVAQNGCGYATEAWERDDLEQLLDQAADEIERLRALKTCDGTPIGCPFHTADK